ncbi:uncharacterized protein LOC116304052 [Actinia tenebrosa]|uniref:Uncharacterized protein LOC116304052 n=1 Tax=Actinia tenebrosa TaxID=6105 RepID=A0A6P8IRQ4_ACTTE|nr:uncharacterized protein LOC116304052 [Actinia tenebrosa]
MRKLNATIPFIVGTFGQPKPWDINETISYQHPMAPYDVLVDPQTLPSTPMTTEPRPSTQETTNGVIEDEEEKEKEIPSAPSSRFKDSLIINDQEIANELKKRPWTTGMGKRLRHEKLRRQPRDTGGPSHYQTLTCFDLDDTPTLPPPPASSIDDPLDFKV